MRVLRPRVRGWAWTPGFREEILVVLLAALFTPLGLALGVGLQYAPLPPSWRWLALPAWGVMFLVPAGWLAMLVGGPIWFVRELRGERRAPWLRVSLAISILAWGSLPGVRLVHSYRQAGLRRISFNARPLIDAVEQFRRNTGAYPAGLEALVPNYLSSVPYTGTVGYPRFYYRLAEPHDRFGSYELGVMTPSGGINFDRYFYWPEGNYPDRIYGGGVERVGEWAYVYE